MSPEVVVVVDLIAEEVANGIVIEVVMDRDEDVGDEGGVEDVEVAFIIAEGVVVVEACLGIMISRMIRLKFWGSTLHRRSTLRWRDVVTANWIQSTIVC
jgi:hypothetical protein